MTGIFISHSNKDKTLAYNLAKELKIQGYTNCFLDFQGIPGGSQWEQEIYIAMRQSNAVLVCTTPEAIGSQWVFAEIVMARYSGIPVIPLIMRMCELPPNLQGTQCIDFTSDPDKGYQDLWTTLHRHDLKPRGIVWPMDKSPYPGLAPFQKEQSSVFFGRELELESAIAMLRPGGLQQRFLVLVGPSGCGKSSFLRAGLIPALEQGAIEDSDKWLFVPPFTPGETPFRNLAEKLRVINQKMGGVQTIERKIKKPNGLLYLLLDLRAGEETRVVLAIDQLEELERRTPRNEAEAFVARLSETIDAPNSPLITLATLRADFISACLNYPGLAKLMQSGVQLLGTMDRKALRRAILGPACIAGLTFEDGLVEEILDDTQGGDALPLLAHVLNQLWIDYFQANRISK